MYGKIYYLIMVDTQVKEVNDVPIYFGNSEEFTVLAL